MQIADWAVERLELERRESASPQPPLVRGDAGRHQHELRLPLRYDKVTTSVGGLNYWQ